MIDRSDLHAEISRLRREVDYWKAMYEDLRKANCGTGDMLGLRLGTTPAQTRIIRLLMSGRAYQLDDIRTLCLKEDTEPKTVTIHFCHIRKRVPWITITAKSSFNNGYALHPDTIARLKALADTPSLQRSPHENVTQWPSRPHGGGSHHSDRL
jgi:hypothetical protein